MINIEYLVCVFYIKLVKLFLVDLRMIGRCVFFLIVDNLLLVVGIVNDGEIYGVDLDFIKYEDKVNWLKY